MESFVTLLLVLGAGGYLGLSLFRRFQAGEDVFFVDARKTETEPNRPDVGLPTDRWRGLIEKYASLYHVDPDLIEAHMIVESRGNADAINPSDPSMGLMQILCVGGPDNMDAPCRNRFPAISEWPEMTGRKLMDPETNIRIGAQIIAANATSFPNERSRQIIAYNNWSAARNGPPFPEIARDYLEKVIHALDSIHAAGR